MDTKADAAAASPVAAARGTSIFFTPVYGVYGATRRCGMVRASLMRQGVCQNSLRAGQAPLCYLLELDGFNVLLGAQRGDGLLHARSTRY